MIIGFANMEIIGDFANKHFTGVMKNLDWNMCTNKWLHFIMYKLYLNKVDLKAQEEPLLSVAKTLSSQCRGPEIRS